MTDLTFVFHADSDEVIRFLDSFCKTWFYYLTFAIEEVETSTLWHGEMYSQKHHRCRVIGEGSCTLGTSTIGATPSADTGILLLGWAPTRISDALWGMTLQAVYSGAYTRLGMQNHAGALAQFRLTQEKIGECRARLVLPKPGAVALTDEDTYHALVWSEAELRIGECWRELLAAWNEHSVGSSEAATVKKRGPTAKTLARAEVFKRLKDTYPHWGLDTVAMKASEELSESVTGDTVRNAYRAMGWTWERADRVR